MRKGLGLAVLLVLALLFAAPLLRSLDVGHDAASLGVRIPQIAAHHDALFSDPRSPIVGNPAGDVTIVEFFDYHCPYCKVVSRPLDQLLAEDKGVRLVLKEFPILSQDSVVAARAALAAAAQGKYWSFHQALMAHRGDFDMTALQEIATSVGLDAGKMEADMAAANTSPPLRSNRDLAEAIGVTGTPTFIIGDRVIPGAISSDDLKALIAEARKGRGGAS